MILLSVIVQTGKEFRAVPELLGEDTQRVQTFGFEIPQMLPGLGETRSEFLQTAGGKIVRPGFNLMGLDLLFPPV